MAYSKEVTERYKDTKNIGTLPDGENVGTGMVGSPACGDVMKLQIQVEHDRIVDVKYKVFGCGSAIASASKAAERLMGASLEEAMALKNDEIAQALSLPPVKIHCSVLAEETIKAAVQDLQKKRAHKQEAL